MLAQLFEIVNALFFLALLGGGIYLFFGMRRRCPSCSKLFSRNLKNTTILKRNILTGWREEKYSYECNKCAHKWHEEKGYHVN